MSLSASELQALASDLAADAKFLSVNTADPGTTGANESSAARQAVACTASGGVTTVPACAFTGGAASGAATWVSLWSAATGGTYLGKSQITSGDTTFNAAGQFDTSSFTVTFS
ncbi:MAG TPA: hypothetical protein VN088_16280 [Nocardioides sp.]|nr:hypothetical protein [Nocardioides sp.]